MTEYSRRQSEGLLKRSEELKKEFKAKFQGKEDNEKRQEVGNLSTEIKEADQEIKKQVKENLENKEAKKNRKESKSIGITLEGNIEEANTPKGQVVKAKAYLSVLLELSVSAKEEEKLPLPSNETNSKVAQAVFDVLRERGVENVGDEASVIVLKLVSKLYEDEEGDPNKWFNKDDIVALYWLDDELARRLFNEIETELIGEPEDKRKAFENLLAEAKKELAEKGLKELLVPTLPGRSKEELTESEARELVKYWGEVAKIQSVLQEKLREKIDELEGELEEIRGGRAPISGRSREEIEEELKEYINWWKELMKVDDFLFTYEGGVEGALTILKTVAQVVGRRLLSHTPDILTKINEGIDRLLGEEEKFAQLNAKVVRDQRSIIERFGGMMFRPEQMDLRPEDFQSLSEVIVVKNFGDIFEVRDGRLVFKNEGFVLDTLAILHKILSNVAYSYKESWQNAFDPYREGVAIKLLKYQLTHFIRQAKRENSALRKQLEEFAGEKGIDVERLVDSFQELIGNVRVEVDNEFSAFVFHHELYRNFLEEGLRELDALIKLYRQFNTERLAHIYGGIQRDLIDLAARTFEKWLEDKLAHADNELSKLGPDFFHSLYDPSKIFAERPSEAYQLFKEIALELIREEPSFRKLLNLGPNWEENVDMYLRRAFYYGVGRSFIEKSIGIIAAAKPMDRHDYRDLPFPQELLATYAPWHHWLLGRAGTDMKKILWFMLETPVREERRRRLKPHVPKKIWDLVTKAEVKTLNELIELVSQVDELIDRELEAEYEREGRPFKYWMVEKLGLPPMEDRAAWREMEALKAAYKEATGKEFKNDADTWEEIYRIFGPSILWRLAESRAKDEVAEILLKRELGDNYEENYTDEEIENKREKLLTSKNPIKRLFKDLDGNHLEISPKEFVEKKIWLYKGAALYRAFERTPVGFLTALTRLVPEIAHIYKDKNGKIVNTFQVLFEWDEETLRRNLPPKTWKEVLKVRERLLKEWPTYSWVDLKEFSKAWLELRKRMFNYLKSQGKISDQKTWESNAEEFIELIDSEILKADALLTRRLMAREYDKRKGSVREYVDDEGLNKLTDEEKIIYHVFFDTDTQISGVGSDGLTAEEKFDAKRYQNLRFADAGTEEEILQVYKDKKDFFTQMAQSYSIVGGKMYPIVGDTDRGLIEKYRPKSGSRIEERDTNDRKTFLKAHEALMGTHGALFDMASKNDETKFREILQAIKGLEGIVGSDGVKAINEILIQKAVEFKLEHWLIRLMPPPLNMIAGWLFGKNAALSRIILKHPHYHTFSDDEAREFVYKLANEGYIGIENAENILYRLYLSQGIFSLKTGTKLFILLTIVTLIYSLQKAIEEETEGKG